MPCIDGELEHVETVFEQFFPEVGVVLPVFLGFGWQVEKYQNPHDAVFVETFQDLHFWIDDLF